MKVYGLDDDPMNDWCDACGAEPAEECRPGCVGKAAHDDAQEQDADEK